MTLFIKKSIIGTEVKKSIIVTEKISSQKPCILFQKKKHVFSLYIV